ncbi:MAG: glycerol-3-phosphate acyltransferase [Eubacterium sp.]|nr:glycerol-3-phosphate acyltransferase [Eubacterium sp.]
MEIVLGIIFLVVGYFFGCFSTGYIVGKMNGHDIRNEGSGNIGTTNALRTMGAKGGALTFGGDLLKAFIPTLLVRFLICPAMGYTATLTYLFTLLTGLGVVAGHNFPFYLHFKGGKGIAVSAAVIMVSSSNSTMGWIMIACGWALFLMVVACSRYVSLGSLLVVWYFPLYTILYHVKVMAFESNLQFILALVISLIFTALAYIKHAGNIKRLLNGTERKLGEKKKEEV